MRTMYRGVITNWISTLAVASSITMILLLLSRALARHNNCRCPTLKLEPLSTTSESKPLDSVDACFVNCTYHILIMMNYYKL